MHSNETKPNHPNSAIAGVLVLAAAQIAFPADAEPRHKNPEINELLELAETSSTAFMRGDMQSYVDIVHHHQSFSLFQPFGGPASHGFDRGEAHLNALSRYFANGETRVELVNAYQSGDMAFLALIEHQDGEVGGLPKQDWSLRVTFVFKKQHGKWVMLHRHADPLVQGISLEHAAELARQSSAK